MFISVNERVREELWSGAERIVLESLKDQTRKSTWELHQPTIEDRLGEIHLLDLKVFLTLTPSARLFVAFIKT